MVAQQGSDGTTGYRGAIGFEAGFGGVGNDGTQRMAAEGIEP